MPKIKGKEQPEQKRIGIYSGVFDPIHNGHIAFAEAALVAANLDEVFLMVERTPRRKTNVTDYHHRLAMVRIVVKGRPKLRVLAIQQPVFTVEETLPRLQKAFPGAELSLLMGSDLFGFVDTWPGYRQLRANVSFIVGKREQDNVDPDIVSERDYVFTSPLPLAASLHVRQAVALQRSIIAQTPRPVCDYIIRNQLYSTNANI